jgi:hypothetical protein
MIFLFRLFQLIIKIDENKKRILIINILVIFSYENSNERSLISENLRKKFDKFSSKEISIINDEYIIKLGNKFYYN